MALSSRLTSRADQCGGRPCVRGMRILVSDVLDPFAAGITPDDILAEMPDLEPDDLRACLSYAARRACHTVLVTA